MNPSQPTMLITGATGNVGSEVVRELLHANVAIRLGAWDAAQAQASIAQHKNAHLAQIVPFDFVDASTYAQAFVGITHLFLVRPPQLADVPKQIAPALDGAIEAGVRHIVFLSLQGVENNRITPHYKIEQYIRQKQAETGITFTFLRASFFMQNLSTTHRDEIRDEDVIAVPVGQARTSFIDVRDIAAVGAQALRDDAHHNQAYTLTGAEALTYGDVATIMTEELGRNITYTNPNPIAFFIKQWRTGGRMMYAFVVTMLYVITRQGNASETTDDVARVLQRPPINFRQFVRDNQTCWQAS
jgi:uncharacterized protein YbjT (DUF2867 family)